MQYFFIVFYSILVSSLPILGQEQTSLLAQKPINQSLTFPREDWQLTNPKIFNIRQSSLGPIQ